MKHSALAVFVSFVACWDGDTYSYSTINKEERETDVIEAPVTYETTSKG